MNLRRNISVSPNSACTQYLLALLLWVTLSFCLNENETTTTFKPLIKLNSMKYFKSKCVTFKLINLNKKQRIRINFIKADIPLWLFYVANKHFRVFENWLSLQDGWIDIFSVFEASDDLFIYLTSLFFFIFVIVFLTFIFTKLIVAVLTTNLEEVVNEKKVTFILFFFFKTIKYFYSLERVWTKSQKQVFIKVNVLKTLALI